MNKRYYKSIYGATASITTHKSGTATLVTFAGCTRKSKKYKNFRSAYSALCRWGECIHEVKG